MSEALIKRLTNHLQVKAEGYRARRGNRSDRRGFMVTVTEAARDLDLPESTVITAARKAEDLGLIRTLGDPAHTLEIVRRP